MRKIAPFLLCLFASATAFAQIAIGQWRDHLPYKTGIAVTEGGGYVYCATDNAVFTLKKSDNAFEKLSKVTGLSDVGVSDVKYNSYNGVVLISYRNGNLDLVQGLGVFNISDIKRSNIIANKIINSIYYSGRYAYLACGFGIVKFDTERREVSDTYYIGANGGYINVLDITMSGNFIYAATDSGIFRASLSAPNLADFNAWSRFTGLPQGSYNTICAMGNRVFANYSRFLTSNQTIVQQDTLLMFDGTSWDYFTPDTSGFVCRSLEPHGNTMVATYNGYIVTYDINLAVAEIVSSFQTGFFIDPSQSVRDADNYLWIADRVNGLIRNWDTWTNERFAPDGPATNKVYNMDLRQGALWVAPGERSDLWINQYNWDGAFSFVEEEWGAHNFNSNPELYSVRDIVDVTIDPNNTKHVYMGSLGRGLIEYNNGVITEIWNDSNSTLEVRCDAPTSGWVGVFGSAFDEDGNLWVTNSLSNNGLSVRKADGSWLSFNLSAVLNCQTLGQIIVTKSGQKWIILPRGGGILVFDDNGTIGNPNDDNMKKLTSAAGQGGLPSNEVYSIAEDEDGEIWVGTDAGIAVFYSPEDIFGNDPSDAQQILIEQDGHTQILLETEVVTAICIDGANRKWLGTQNAGVFLMSPDGTKEIHHFDETNSPLFSNNVTSIAINGSTGEVFIGTAKGILSYKGTATEGTDEFGDVYAYPNPVRPGYGGVIAIKGLVKDADVKITDITGTLVYQTKALGGQAIWNGNNFKGERARSGIYLVFCSNDDGTKTYVTKICIVN
ncbi:MAG: two-component regulator propeller domain-containing protein [Bacteroidota bacterium]